MYTEYKNPELRTFSMALYMIAGMSGLLQFFETTVILGTILLVISFFMVKAQRLTARETLYASHVEWTARTLSRGTFIFFPAALIISLYLIIKNTDFEPIKAALNSDDAGAMMDGIHRYMGKSIPYISHITTITMAPVIFWWVRRCVFGFIRAKNAEPIDYPDGFL